MKLAADATIHFPRDVVFAAYRDELSHALPWLPSLRGIENKSRKEDGPRIEMVNEWQGGGEVPAAARAVLGASVLSWTDYAIWNRDQWACDWRIEPHVIAEAVTCSGRNVFLEDGPDRTLLQIRGNLEIDASKIRGVPSFLASKVSRPVEDYLGGKIQPSLVDTIRGLEKYLESKSQNTKG